MRGLPVEVISNPVVAPFRPVLFVERRTAIVAGKDGTGRRLERRNLDLRHCSLTPRQGDHVDTGRIRLVGKGSVRRRTEAETITGAELVPLGAFRDHEAARLNPDELADVRIGRDRQRHALPGRQLDPDELDGMIWTA